MNLRNPSPLRYPGGKISLTRVLEEIIYDNRLQGCTYVEPFAGGAGAGLKLLLEGHVDRVVINDADRAIAAFWGAVMHDTEELIDLISSTPISIDEWERQREIYRSRGRCRRVKLGFAAFYLNRCNRSGIIPNGGPIGGIKQEGRWKIDARFNREGLVRRIRTLSEFGDRICILSMDAEELLKNLRTNVGAGRCFVYADPPYYVKGGALYLNFYEDADHASFAQQMNQLEDVSWVITYDDHPRIQELYSAQTITSFRLRYSAHRDSEEGGEVLISPSHVRVGDHAKMLLASLGASPAES